MRPSDIDFLSCPICALPLIGQESSLGRICFRCENRHAFDPAKEGYVHLLPSGKMHSLHPGDDKEMVRARRLFHSGDHYRALKHALTDMVRGSSLLIDCGCGEGYYTSAFADCCEKVLGLDLSKEAVRIASKIDHKSLYIVAGSFHMPLPDGCADVVTNIFTPIAHEEIFRVLKDDGLMISVIPGKRHLWQMKEALYETPYPNSGEAKDYPAFRLVECRQVHDVITVTDRGQIKGLYEMTPYSRKSSREAADRIAAMTTLETEIEFLICVYKKMPI